MRGMKTGGRQKGTPNKITASAREAIEQAFEGLGGAEALTRWAKVNRTLFYTRIWPKLLPLQIGADAQSPADFTIRWEDDAEKARETLRRDLLAIRTDGQDSAAQDPEKPAEAYPVLTR